MNFTIEQLLIVTFVIFGINAITREGKLFGFISRITTYRGEDRFKLAGAVLECRTCMSSFYGFIGYVYLTETALQVNRVEYTLLGILVLAVISEALLQDKLQKSIFTFASTTLYLFLMCMLIAQNAMWDSIVFILACAGLNNLLDYFMVMAGATQEVANNIEDLNRIQSKE